MEAWCIAPVVVLVLSGVALLAAGAVARRSATSVADDRPALEALQVELNALHDDLTRVAARLDDGTGAATGGAGAGTTDR